MEGTEQLRRRWRGPVRSAGAWPLTATVGVDSEIRLTFPEERPPPHSTPQPPLAPMAVLEKCNHSSSVSFTLVHKGPFSSISIFYHSRVGTYLPTRHYFFSFKQKSSKLVKIQNLLYSSAQLPIHLWNFFSPRCKLCSKKKRNPPSAPGGHPCTSFRSLTYGGRMSSFYKTES